MKGQIVQILAGFYDIESNQQIYRVRGAGKLRQQTLAPIVGDFVEFTPEKFVTHIYPRKNWFIRPKVANIDQAIIVMSLKKPNFSSFLCDKFLAIVEAKDITPIIVLTKIDLDVDSKVKDQYQSQGYKVLTVNNLNFKTTELLNLFVNKTTVFMGQSGVGKSSTINNIANLDLPTQAISEALNRGKHTTRVVTMINFAGGKLIDTPGFSSIDFDLTKRELAHAYHDFRRLSFTCKFRQDCLHATEYACAIKKAVENHIILKSRYLNYLKLLEEAK